MVELHKKRRARLKVHALFLERKCRERQEHIVDLNKAIAEMRPRLVPEGMEWLAEAWPRFEDGEPVRFGGEFIDHQGNERSVLNVKMWQEGGFEIGTGQGTYDWHEAGERVKRPAPKVFDADGAEIEVGDDLYSVEGGLKFHVSQIDRAGGKIATDAMFAIDKWADPSLSTHRAPVLAADGKPLREGETVWVTKDSPCDAPLAKGDEVTVRHAYPKYVSVEDGAGDPWIVRSDHLTHERPDSWERLEEDVAKNPFDYCKDVGHRLDTCENAEAYKARDLVRRAKALAGDA